MNVRLAAVVACVFVLLAACSGSSHSRTPTPQPAADPPTTKVAYVHAGDIYVDALDGTPQRLTTDANSGSPKWSPSGDWLLVSSGGAKFVMRSNGSARRPVGDVSWDRNSDVLVSFDPRGRVVIENADSSNHRKIPIAGPSTPVAEPGPGSAVLSPDGQWIAYQQSGLLPGATPPFAYDGIWKMRVDGSDAHELYNTGSPSTDGLVLLGWSSDGRKLIFQRDVAHSASIGADGLPIEVIDANGGTPQRVTGATLTSLGFEQQPGGSPIVGTDGGGRETWRDKRVALFDPAQAVVTPLTDQTTSSISPSWSPDGKQIAYVSAPDAGDAGGGDAARDAMAKRRIWIMNADGPDKRRLTDDAAYRDERPRWSADGSQIVFSRIDVNDRASLWMVPSAGGTPRQIADDLSPNPEGGGPFWFGYYGKINWDALFDVSTVPRSP